MNANADTQPVILTTVDDGIAVVTLNRPAARNALNSALRSALAVTMADLEAAPEVAVIVLTGSDPAFCAGLDLKELAGETAAGETAAGETAAGERGVAAAVNGHLPFEGVSKPLIGAVNGAAITGGFELALGCDFIIASERAGFADTHARVGVMPGWGLTVFLPQAIGRRRARQMSFTGNFIDAPLARDWGLVNEVVPHNQLLDRARELAADMVGVPPANLRGIKQAYRAANRAVDHVALAAERDFSRDWMQSFDQRALAANRQAIQERGRSQTER